MHKKEIVKTRLQVKIKEVKKLILSTSLFQRQMIPWSNQPKKNCKYKKCMQSQQKAYGHVELDHDLHASAAAIFH